MSTIKNFDHFISMEYIPHKLLVGGGPPNCSPRVKYALGQNTLSAICNEIYLLMDEIQEMLRYVFQTHNKVTFGMHASGTGGVEAALLNTVAPGETIIIPVFGFWGARIVDIAKRRQINVIELNCKPGTVFDLPTLEKEIIKHKPAMLFIVHGESSNGVVQPLEGLGELCQANNCLLAIDAIGSLGCVPLFVDKWKIDIAVSSSNKAMRGPAGISYLTISPKAVEKMNHCKSVPPLYYDIRSLGGVWNCFEERTKYHNTFTAQYLFAAKEGIHEIIDQGLEASWENYKKVNKRLRSGLENIGLKPFLQDLSICLPMINLFHLPSEINTEELVNYISKTYQVQFGTGLGPQVVERCLRVGTMGYNARPEVVDRIVDVIDCSIKHFLSEKRR